ncbi:MAG: ABC transporter permease [Candidatus Bathyarchaeota archaeon]|nr:ABC transporter permease [Candidatus Bathyarchaeota archaeon]
MKSTTTAADGSFILALDAGVSKLLVYSDDPSTPGYDYVPALVGVPPGGVVSITLEPAASLSMRGDLLFVDTDNIPVSYSYQVVDANGTLLSPSGYPLSFGSKGSTLIQIPNLPSSTIIVPAGIPYRLWVGASILVGTKVTTRSVSSGVQQPLAGGTMAEFDVMGVTLNYNLGLVGSAISDASQRIVTMEGQGFYLVREKGIIAKAEVNYVAAQQHYEAGEYTEGFDSAKRSYIDAKSTLGDLSNLALDAASSVYIIIGFLAVASVTAGFLLVDSTRLQIGLGAGVYAAALLVLSRVYPGVGATPLQGFLLTTVASYLAVVAVAVFLPRFLGGGGGDGRVSLSGVLVPVFSIAKRSLKRRRLRFALTLVSLTVLVMSFVALTSLSEGYGLMVVKSSSLTIHRGVLLRASTWTESEPTFMEFVDAEVEWLLRQEGVGAVSVKVENTPQKSAITSISGNRIYSIVGVDAGVESQIIPLSSALVEGKLPGPGGVALSVSLAAKAGLKLGDTVKLRDRVLTLEGLLDDAAFSSLTDLDGGSYIPDKWVNLSPPGDPPYWERQATPASEAALVDASTAKLIRALGVTRIALKVDAAGQDAFAERLALQRGYETWSVSGTSVVYAALGSYLEGKGLPLVIPWAIVVLNVVVTMLNSLFERRREIGILSSVGLNPAEISSIFVAEASITGFIAGGLGYLAGLAFYKLMPMLGLALEVHQKVSAVWSLAAIGISISAVLVGAFAALRSSVVVTPSLTRKWKMDEGEGGFNKPWVVPVPVKIEAGDVDSYVGYMLGRLRGLETDQVRMTSRVTLETRGDARVVSFIYKSYQATTGNFYTKNSVFVEPSGGVYGVRLESAGGQDWAHETGTLIRLITMEWSNRPR